jgi:predicted dehydrogenase
MKLRIGVIGQGRDWHSRYLPALRAMRDRFLLVGFYNAVHALAETSAREFDAIPFVSFRELLETDGLDGVLILEEGWYGLIPLLVAAKEGKAVFCGGEIDLSTTEASQLQKQIQGAGVAFMTEFSRRYAPATIRLKELIATRLGKPRLLFCHRRLACETKSARNERSLHARTQRELVELIDWCNYIVGEAPSWVQAIAHQGRMDSQAKDYQIVSVGFGDPEVDPSAVLAQISCGAYIPQIWSEAIAYRPPAAVQVCCENGVAFVDLPATLVWFDEAGRHQESLDTELPIGQQMFSLFHRSVTSLVRNISDLEQTCAAMKILDSARTSTETHCRVVMDH